MAKDKNQTTLQEGDTVTLECRVTQIADSHVTLAPVVLVNMPYTTSFTVIDQQVAKIDAAKSTKKVE